jgi:hypothetical protein
VVPVCLPSFNLSSIRLNGTLSIIAAVLEDFNNDDRLDFAYFSPDLNGINVLLGVGNGSFDGNSIFSSLQFGYFTEMVAGDFSEDNYLDLLGTDTNDEYLTIVLGNGNGTFRSATQFYSAWFSAPLCVALSDLNGDDRLDIIVASDFYNYVAVFSGNGNGTFREHTRLYTGLRSYIDSLVVNDFNNDNHSDVLVLNYNARNIGVFLGDTNGGFESQIVSFTGGDLEPAHIAVGDFNSDHFLDVVFSYTVKYNAVIMFGFGNGSFSDMIKFSTAMEYTGLPTAVADFNRDSYLDIVFQINNPSRIDILLGDGKGHFQRRRLVSISKILSDYVKLLVGDFNKDGYQDIINMLQLNGYIEILLNTGECRP